MKQIYKTVLTVLIFSIAMGFMETAVVVYLRELHYPAGFSFPLAPVSWLVFITELGRELATIIMLVCIGIIAGKSFAQRFVFFLFSFAVWDITYYVFLKVLLNWPASLLTWDILFLIPVPWAGPVLAPCIISLSMIMFTFIVIYIEEKKREVIFTRHDWFLMLLYSFLIIVSFTADYFELLFTTGETVTSLQVSEMVMKHIPESYNWLLFSIAQLILFADFYLIFRRSTGRLSNQNMP